MSSNPIVIESARVGDKLKCPGCGEMLTLDWADGWTNRNGFTCSPTNTVHTDHIRTLAVSS